MNKKRIWLIVIVVLVLLCVVAAFLLFRGINNAVSSLAVDDVSDQIQTEVDRDDGANNAESVDSVASDDSADDAGFSVDYDSAFAILTLEDYCKVLTAIEVAEYFNEGAVVQVAATPDDDAHIYCYYWFESGSYLSLYLGALQDESSTVEEYNTSFVEKYGTNAEEVNGNFSEGFWNPDMMAIATRNGNIIALAQLTSQADGLREGLWFFMEQYYAYLGEISE